MSKLKSISRQKLNTVIKRLPVPVQEHCKRCKLLTSFLLDRLRSEEWFIDEKYNVEDIASAVYYHDIGKVRVPKDNLYLIHCTTVVQRDIYRSHAVEGLPLTEKTVEAKLENYGERTFERYLLSAISEHHERLDGSGFPNRLKEENISFVGRIAAIVDTFDNLVFVGGAEEGDFEKAVTELKNQAGKKLDKDLVELLCHDEEILRDFVNYICKSEKTKRKNDKYGIRIRFSPVVNISEERIVAYNAQMVLNDPYYGEVTQDKVLSVADKTGQIFKLQRLGLDRLIRDISLISSAGVELPRVWFMISARNFEKKKFFSELEKIFAKYNVPTSSVGFAISEADMFSEDCDYKSVFAEFRFRGWQVSIDDFGNKSSILTNLADNPSDRVMFSAEMTKKSVEYVKTADIAGGMVSIVENLDIMCAFDGVDTKKTEAAIAHMGVRYAAGPLYGKLLSAKDIISGGGEEN